MLRIRNEPLQSSAASVLSALQLEIDKVTAYADRVTAANLAWASKTSTASKAAAFRVVRETLARMCVGPVRCAYCEDSLADEIEHIQPKNLFPELVFAWSNYLFACGPCNGPKSNRYGRLVGDSVVEYVRKRGEPIEAPEAGIHALIDPRREDPMDFLELDLGGVAPNGMQVQGTFNFIAADNLSLADRARAEFSIEVLSLNREVMRVARGSAFGGFRARLREYVEEKRAGASPSNLRKLQDSLLGADHLTVFAELRRQRARHPDIDLLIQDAPEVLTWPP